MRKELYRFFCPPLSLVQNCSRATNTCLITSISFYSVALLVVCFIFKKETDLIIWIMWPVVWLPPFKTQVIKVQIMTPRNAPYISQCLSLVPAGAKQAADLHREEFQEVVREGHFPIMLPGMDSVQSSFTNGYYTEIMMRFPRSTCNAFHWNFLIQNFV